MSAQATTTTTARKPWESWQLEGSAAEAYERYLVPVATAGWADQLIDRLDPAPGTRALDVGCGTGIVARKLTARVGAGGSVVGLDLNPDMLAVARRESAGLRPAIDWRQGDAADLPFAAGAFDLVCCQYAIQFFPDPAAALSEAHRVLAPGGRLGLSVGRPVERNRVYGEIADAMARHVGEQAGAMMRSIFPAWDTAALHDLVAGAGFSEVEVRIEYSGLRYPSADEMLRQEASYSPLAAVFATLDAATGDALFADIRRVLAPCADDAGVNVPIESHVVVARR